MRRLIQTAALTAAFAAAFVSQHGTAHADELSTYAQSMRAFTPVIADWTTDVDHMAVAIQTKPELACSTDIADLAHRGRGIAIDLFGTAAPEALAGQHTRLANAIDHVATITNTSCGSPIALESLVSRDMREARAALVWIRYYTDRPAPAIGIDHPRPDAGN